MKSVMLFALAGGFLVGCVHRDVEYRDSGEVIVEPSGAAATNDWSDQPRDINQRPYGRQFDFGNRTVDPD